MSDCPAVLNIAGEHFACDWPSDDDGRHSGWAHGNKAAQAIWIDDPASLNPKYSPDETMRAQRNVL